MPFGDLFSIPDPIFPKDSPWMAAVFATLAVCLPSLVVVILFVLRLRGEVRIEQEGIWAPKRAQRHLGNQDPTELIRTCSKEHQPPPGIGDSLELYPLEIFQNQNVLGTRSIVCISNSSWPWPGWLSKPLKQTMRVGCKGRRAPTWAYIPLSHQNPLQHQPSQKIPGLQPMPPSQATLPWCRCRRKLPLTCMTFSVLSYSPTRRRTR